MPIAQRELRIACRKPGTFWVRIIIALVGVVIGGFCFARAYGGIPMAPVAGIGKALFAILSWISLAAALSAGLFVTSDCISEEKRDGTLGLLFLTDLKGYDVVAGKFLATSLRSLYGMIALFPVLGVTLLMGGVTGGEFWRTALALINALFFSLAAGLFVSSIGRDWSRVLSNTLWLLLLFNFLILALAQIASHVSGFEWFQHISLASPFMAFRRATGYAVKDFWLGIIVTQCIAWTFLGVSSFVIPRSWQERGRKNAGASSSRRYAWTYGSPGRRERVRRRLLGINPVLWLACRERRQSWGAWILSLAFGVLFFLPLLLNWDRGVWSVWSVGVTAYILLLYLWMASQACRFFIHARRSGLIELLVVGPLTPRSIVQGQWRGLVKTFGGPLALVVVLDIAATMLSAGSWGAFVPYRRLDESWAIAGLSSVAKGAAILANVAALGWFGMWMGLTSKSTNLATFKTILFVQVIPWFPIMIGTAVSTAFFFSLSSGISDGAYNSAWASWVRYLPAFTAAGLAIAKDVGFIQLARGRLHGSFRERAARNWEAPHAALPPVISSPIPR